MNTLYKHIVILSAIIFLFYCSAKGQEVSTGLKFATQEQLEGIPFASTPYAGDELPSNKDLSSNLPEVGNQGRQNSCVAWAVAYALKSFQEKVETQQTLYFSPSFIYNQINNGVDGGSNFIDALNLLSQQGCALWDDMPYSEYDYLTKPSYNCKANSKKYRIDFWRRVNVRDIKEVKAQLNAGLPVLIGVAIDQGFIDGGYNNRWSDYIWKYSNGYSKGGHAMLVVGFDDDKNAFKIINSWGKQWGNSGYCYIDYNLFTSVVREGYVTKDAINGPSDITIKPDNNPIYKPDNKPTDFTQISFYNSTVEHNVYDTYYGNGMRITGHFDIPGGIGKIFQVSVHFYFSNTNTQVGSSLPPKYSDINGFAASGTQVYYIPSTGIKNSNWIVFIPYSAFNIYHGYNNGYQYIPYTTYMYAIPTLFIDNFGVAKGGTINFYVNR